MSKFADHIIYITIMRGIIQENQKEFAVIRNRIERRWILLATPRELMKMHKILKQNTRLFKAIDKCLTVVRNEVEAEKASTPPEL